MRVGVFRIHRREKTLVLNLFLVFNLIGEDASLLVTAPVQDFDPQGVVFQQPRRPHVQVDVDDAGRHGSHVGNEHEDVTDDLCIAAPGKRIEDASEGDYDINFGWVLCLKHPLNAFKDEDVLSHGEGCRN